MTKKEIYHQVVELTTELEHTNVVKAIFNAVARENAVETQMIFDAFPLYYPELHKRIADFGEKFNELVGDSEEDNENYKSIFNSCGAHMYALAHDKVIGDIIDAVETGDAMKVKTVIEGLLPGQIESLKSLQKDCTEYFDRPGTASNGAIFGIEADEENDVYSFDESIIDPLSFYVLTILGKIVDFYFFYDKEDGGSAEVIFYDAMEKVVNVNFDEFVRQYNVPDWIGEDSEYEGVGEVLVDAWTGDFDDTSYFEYTEEELEEESE